MKTFLKVILILFLIVAGLVGVVLGTIEWYLHSDSFKAMVRKGTRDVRGFEVKDFDISLFRGVTLKGLAIITNMLGAQGLSFATDSLHAQPRILPLFHHRVELAEISLQKPVVTLHIGTAAVMADNTNAFAKTGEFHRSNWQFVLDKFTVRDGCLTLLDASNKPLTRLDGLNLDVTPPQSSGLLHAETLRVGKLAIRQLDAPVKAAAGRMDMAPIRGTLANGPLTGSLAVQSQKEFRWQLQVDVRDADVPDLLRQFGLPPLLKGKLQGTASLEGGDSLSGQGRIQINGGTASGIPLMSLLATLLQTPALRDLQLDECRMEFTIATNQMHTPVIRMISQQIELTGRGVVSLTNGSLNHDLTLVLSQEVADRTPGLIRKLLTEQADGRRALSFHVSGTYDDPKVDIDEHAVKRTAEKALNKLQKFLH